MNALTFENKIVKLLPSPTLKDKISEVGHKFGEREILKIINDYSPSFKEKLILFKQAKSVFKDKKCIEHAEKLIKYYTRIYKGFTKTDEDYVFEVGIRTSPSSYEDKYLSKTFDGINTIIKNYLRYYASIGVKDNKLSSYTVKKRPLKIPSKPSELAGCCNLGTCLLGYKLKILSVDYYSIQNEYSDNCNRECEKCNFNCLQNDCFKQLNLPPFLKKYDLITFMPERQEYSLYGLTLENKGKPLYGINSFDMDEHTNGDFACVLMLDSLFVKNRTVETKDKNGYYPFFMDHEHIEYPKITKVEPSDAPKEVYDDYMYTVEQLKLIDKNKSKR